MAQLRVPAAIRDMCKPHDVNQRSPSEWEVTAGLPLQVFLEAVGPAAITRCNLHVHKPFAALATATNWLRLQQHSTSCNTSATTYTSPLFRYRGQSYRGVLFQRARACVNRVCTSTHLQCLLTYK